MKGKFNYFIPFIRLVWLIGPLMFLWIMFAVPSKGEPLWNLFFFVFLSYVVYRTIYLLAKQRFNFKLLDNEIEVSDILQIKNQTIPFISIKGYSNGLIKTRAHNFEEIIIYCKNGEIYQIAQYNFFNFKKIKEAIRQNRSMKCLGAEKTKWSIDIAFKDLIDRQYRFK